MAKQTAAEQVYLALRQTRRDWAPIEAARVAAHWPQLSPRDRWGHSVPGTDIAKEELAQSLVDELGGNPVVRTIDTGDGYTIRQYADGMFDASGDDTKAVALSPGFSDLHDLREFLHNEERRALAARRVAAGRAAR